MSCRTYRCCSSLANLLHGLEDLTVEKHGHVGADAVADHPTELLRAHARRENRATHVDALEFRQLLTTREPQEVRNEVAAVVPAIG
eukprot:1032222-Pyramimonas_sp.AAC.1